MSLAETDCCPDAEGAVEAPQAAQDLLDAALAALPHDHVNAVILGALRSQYEQLIAIHEQLAAQNAFMTQVAEMVAQAAPVMDAIQQGGVGGIFKLLRG